MDDILTDEEILVISFPDAQVIFPKVNFTCSGSIQSWVFGAQWDGRTDSYTELQIWRPVSRDGVYSKVGSTTIMTEENSTRLYHYPLSFPVTFQAGDVLGFYQPEPSRSQLTLLGEALARGRQLGYYYHPTPSAASQLNIRMRGDDRYQVFINVITGEFTHLVVTLCECHVPFRPSRLWVWFHEYRENETTTGSGQYF